MVNEIQFTTAAQSANEPVAPTAIAPASETLEAPASETQVAPASETLEAPPASEPAEQPTDSPVAEDVPSPEASPSEADTPKPQLQVLLPLSEMTPEERFRATAKLIFLAPDVPPILPRQRRNDLRQLDDLLDREFSRGRGRSRNDRSGRSRDLREENELFGDRDRDRDRDQTATRNRSRRRGGSEAALDDDDFAESSALITEPQKIKGSTRLEAKKQRRRDGRDVGRRRRMVITESEFLARRESVDREMIVRTTDDRIQIGVIEDKILVEHYVARSSESSLIGNVYIGRVQNVLPSMEAAFVDIGRGRNAVLYSGEVDWTEFEGSSSQRRIENALKPGDKVLVQVTKDPVGQKGARLTSQISLPGRFLVYVPGGAMNGISRKLPDAERARLKKILKEVLPAGAGVIVRTAAEGVSEEQITGDVLRLTREWEQIQAHAENDSGPQLLHSEPDMLIKIVRDVFNEDFHKMVIQGADTYTTIEGYLNAVAPELLERVTMHDSSTDIFDEYRINEQIIKALDRKVYLPSGGSLVIDRTEAMTVVDVNTGKFVGSGGNLEETVTKNNLEAAEEIVRQLRLRDVGGIIVIDFIDMVLESNRDLVLRRLVECLGRDRTKHQVAEVTSLGLVQMTRKKLGLGLLESFSEPCEVCAGRGVIVQHEPVHRHHSDAAPRPKRKPSTQGKQPVAQANAITDKSRSALAKIAASTIAGAPEVTEATTNGAEDADSSAQPTVAPVKKRGRPSKKTQDLAPADTLGAEVLDLTKSADVPTVQQQTDSAKAEDLLGSVLSALPEAPAPGSRRRGSRRVTVQQPTTDNAESI